MGLTNTLQRGVCTLHTPQTPGNKLRKRTKLTKSPSTAPPSLPRRWTHLIGKQYQERKQQGRRTDLTSGQSDQKYTTAEMVAEENRIGEATVRRAAKFAEAVDGEHPFPFVGSVGPLIERFP